MKGLATLAVLALVTAQAASAACDSYSFADSSTYTAARIAAKAGKVRLKDDEGKLTGSYLLPRDEVVVLETTNEAACIVYVNAKFDETFGWVPKASLAPVPATRMVMQWRGKFTRDNLGSEVTLKPAKGDKTTATLYAYWAMSLELAKKGGANEGVMDGTEPVKDGVLHIPAEPADNNNCEADLRLIGTRYLLVEDNRDRLGDDILTCAGHNVTFTGLYVRTK